jgi:hypothetical protein
MQTLLDSDQLARLDATLYQEDDEDSFFNCNALIQIDPHTVIQVNHARITDSTIMFRHTAGIELFNNAAFLGKVSNILGVKFEYRDRWGTDFVEIEAV